MIRLYTFLALLLLFANQVIAQQDITFGKGYVEGVTATSSTIQSSGIQTLMMDGFMPNDNAASRFLSQATFGADSASIAAVKEQGIETWLEAQLNMNPQFSLEAYVTNIHERIVDSLNAQAPSRNYTRDSVNINERPFDVGWFQGAMSVPDQVRWRVAFALSEIFVVSRRSEFDDNAYALSSYYDVLYENAFGNYRGLIDSITYHPSMAVYLTYMNNHATDTTDNNQIFPDENYAREVMQLFSVGLFELNPDGTEKRDGNNNRIPTYDNDDIADLAKVFTGLSWGDSRYLGDRPYGSFRDNWYTKRLQFFPVDSSDAIKRWWSSNPRIVNGHEPGAKTFLGQTIPARPVAQGEQDISDALDILYNHPNVGPFLSFRLIQRLITSNPSPSYIQRVSSVFDDNGNGVRGDLKAVVRAILLDQEARLINEENPYQGKLKEPFVRYMNLVKGLDLKSESGVIRNRMTEVYSQTEQKPLYSNSVFNFYHPEYQPDNQFIADQKVGPEFELLNSQTVTGYLNALKEWILDNDPVDYNGGFFNQETYKSDEDPRFDFSPYYELTRDNRLSELLDKYNHVLAHGSIKPKNIEAIKTMLLQMPMRVNNDGSLNESDANFKIQMAIFLIMSSPDYLINR